MRVDFIWDRANPNKVSLPEEVDVEHVTALWVTFVKSPEPYV